jgi:23S rRNA (adenine2503-C2)-methyltransferase
MTIKLTELTAAEIAAELELKPFQGRQIFAWLHKKRVFDFDAMTNLSKNLRQRLKETCLPAQLTVARMAKSTQSRGTRKAVFTLTDGETVESVLIRDEDRRTVCISTQVGCPLNCSFCATGASGFTRDLTPGEMVEQALHLLAGENLEDRTPNIVYMGMGEPFRNYDAVLHSIGLLMSKEGLGIGARKITVSTAGHVPGIRQFAKEKHQVRLSISLHAADDALRSKLVPLNKKYPLPVLKKAVEDYIEVTGRQVTFEWVLLRNVNDSIKHAHEFMRFLKGIKATVNLIPYNPVPDLPYDAPERDVCRAFLDAMNQGGVMCTLRRERGQDIEAACGQLRRQPPKAG